MGKTRTSIEKDLLASMAQAVQFAKGARKGFVVHAFTPDDVRLIRAKTKKSQAEFARVFQIPVRTLQKWETGQGRPTGAAATLLRVIAANPRVVEKALEKTA
jgi:putative transcriptional regulator